MFETVGTGDPVLHSKLFIADEVPYNLLHLICESGDNLRLKTVDDTMVFAQTKGFNAWLWLAKEVTEARRETLFRQLIDDHLELDLPGISGEPETAEYFAKMYSKAKHIRYEPYMSWSHIIALRLRSRQASLVKCAGLNNAMWIS
ncbi:hypothetical protein [Paenibacillus humicus]|uniref:hypothetical protein n=1 Tax=Paenibacillus humicus TaxID=412861 RepID=UPI003D26E147